MSDVRSGVPQPALGGGLCAYKKRDKKKKKPKKAENMHLCEKIKTHTGDAMHGAL